MNIKIEEKNGKKFTKDERDFVHLLEEDEIFEPLIWYIRNECGIPFNPDDSNFDSQKADYKRALLYGYILTKFYGPIPMYWMMTFADIITKNKAIPPDKDYYKPIEILTAENITADTGFAIAIIIRENMSLSQLKKFIDENEKVLTEELSYLPKIPDIRLTGLDVKKRMLELKREGNTDSKIGSKILEEFGDKLTFDSGYETIGVIRNRFEQYVEKILSRDPNRLKAIKEAFDKRKKEKDSTSS